MDDVFPVWLVATALMCIFNGGIAWAGWLALPCLLLTVALAPADRDDDDA